MPLHSRLPSILLTLSFVAFGDSKSTCDKASTISFAEAKSRTVAAPAPEIPALAKATSIGGVVKLAVCVSETGAVVSTKLISGHPLLVNAAVLNSKLWRFDPLKSPFNTVLEIEFARPGSAKEQAQEDKANREYFGADEQCRNDLKQSDPELSIRDCHTAINLVDKLPVERVNERRLANEMMGHAYFKNKDFQNALSSYTEELKIAQSTLHDDQAELAYAYHDVALANHLLGKAPEANQDYLNAEAILPRAAQKIHMDGLDKKYLATLRRIQQEHLVLLKQIGDTTGASALQKQIDGNQQ